VQVEFDPMLSIPQRRRFMAPFAVVMLVVLVERNLLPPCAGEEGLRGGQVRMRHQDVHVGGQPSQRDRQVLPDVGCALEQDLGVGLAAERRADTIERPEQSLCSPARYSLFSEQVPSRLLGDGIDQPDRVQPGAEPCEKPQAPREAYDGLPFPKRPAQCHRGIAQRA